MPDAARDGRLQDLIDGVVENNPAFGQELERCLRPLLAPSSPDTWYYNDDPYTAGFVGQRASRAVVDRINLRNVLKELANDQYRVLVISGAARSGKSHSWELIDHVRSAGKLPGSHRFVRLTTHDRSGNVTGEDLSARRD